MILFAIKILCTKFKYRRSGRPGQHTQGLGPVQAADVVKLHSAKAVSGDSISIVANAGGVTVDSAHVVKTDIAATNGVVGTAMLEGGQAYR
jgi:hypothetical protein